MKLLSIQNGFGIVGCWGNVPIMESDVELYRMAVGFKFLVSFFVNGVTVVLPCCQQQ